MKIDLSRFRQTFFQEAADHVNNMETALLTLDAAPDEPVNPEVLNLIFRAVHSIKGGSGTFAFDDLTRFTHRLEELLDRMRQGKVEASHPRVQLLLRACDVQRGLLAAAEAGTPPGPEAEQLLEKLAVAQRDGEFASEPAPRMRAHDPQVKFGGRSTYAIHFRPSPAIFREGMDPLLALRDLADLGTLEEVAADLSRLPELAELQPDTCYLSWNIRLTTERELSEVESVFAFIEDGAEITIEAQAPRGLGKQQQSAANKPATASAQRREGPHRRDSASIRVSTEKVDQLINLVGELVIAQSMTVEIADHFTPARLPELRAALGEVGRNTRELQERVMAVRMLPVGTIFARLPRIVHDIAESSGKSIRVEMTGEETELDKGVLEGMMDPLTHLIRNSADHGIEGGAQRLAAGKPEGGVIRLQARHEGGNFIIEVSDDGRGLDLARIRSKAIERGLLTGSEELSREEIQALIFQPGFSTAEKATEVSGRGVGMDVVRKNVEALGGIVSLKSREGQGTTVIIRLPLTLAVLDGQLVRVGNQIYVLPLVSIVESIQPTRQQVSAVAGQGEVVVVRTDPLPLLRLHQLFGVPSEITDAWRGLVAVIEHETRRFALLVDELLSQQQVVIKNLQTNFRKVEGAMGATILGDGRVSLILDVAGLVERSRRITGGFCGKPRGPLPAGMPAP